MAASTQFSTTLVLTLCLFQFLTGSYSARFTVTNKCNYIVWPAILSISRTSPLSTTGFALNPGESKVVAVPAFWSGSLWGRTLCSHDVTGKFFCITGDCGSSTVECDGGNASLPVTLAEFTMNGAGELDFFDVSLVSGYNLPMVVEPEGGIAGAGKCMTTACGEDLNRRCPTELKVTTSSEEGVACKSACQAFGDPQYCCTGAYATAVTCKPNSYSQFFKSVCPRAYSYAFDNATSTFTCLAANYVITFCPASSSTPRNMKFPTADAVSDLGGDGDGSPKKVTKYSAVVIAVIICGLLIACTIKIHLSNQNCDINLAVGATATAETIATHPQPAVQLRNMLIFPIWF